MIDFQLTADSFGRLVVTLADGAVHTGVTPVRAFPIAAPDDGLSLVSPEGHELAWLASLAVLPDAARQLVERDLAAREFTPEIHCLRAVSSFACPSTWTVDTDRGQAELVLKGEEDIRRLSPTRLLIADRDGINYLLRDLDRLDRHSRKLLDRFL